MKRKTAQTSRISAVFLAIVLIYSPLATIVSAQEATTTSGTTTESSLLDERLGERGADTTPPVIESHDDVNAEATSDSGAVVSYILPATSDDVDGPGVASCTPESGSVFAVGTTVVTCSASDAAGNSAAAISFRVKVAAMSQTATSTSSADQQGEATTTPDTSGTTTPSVGDTGTASSTDPVPSQDGGAGGGASSESAPPDPSQSSTSSTDSGIVAPEESDTDNTDFQNIISGTTTAPCDPLVPGCVQDVSATSTEALALVPQFSVATSTDGTGSKIGGAVFTGTATASTTVKNILNITRSSVDGPGVTNSSIITADTDNVGDVTTRDETRALTGDNGGLGGEGNATVHTGDAISSARVLNVVNTNFFNSKGLVLFPNPQDGDSLDLRSSELEYFLEGGVGASPTHLGCTILTCLNSATLQVLNKNVGEIKNDVYVRAATGGNSATSTKEGAVGIETGNAYASAAVLNLVNTNFINSKYLITAFDNPGAMQGDIVLPDAIFFRDFFKNGNTLPDLNSSSYIVSNDNSETFAGTTTARAITGENIATTTSGGSGHGEVRTGQAHTSATSYTAANQTYVGGSSALFVFHVSGAWSGSVKGLPEGLSWRHTDYGVEIYSTGANTSTSTQGIYNSANFIASSTNIATVNTDVNVWAETGKNYAFTENATGTIMTGNAYASANVVNMVNTNVVNRNFMFAIFNIAGDWQGDIDFGGHSPNLKVTATVDAPNPTAPGTDVTYHLAVANNGDVDAENAVLSAKYDKNLLFISRSSAISEDVLTGTRWNLGRIPAGGSREVVAVGHVSAPGLQAGFSMTLPLSASVFSNTRDQDEEDNTQAVSIVVSLPPNSPGGNSGGETCDPRGDLRGQCTSSGGNTGGGTPPPSGGGPSSPPPSGGGNGSPPSSGSGSPPPSNGGGSAPPPSSGGNPSPSGGGGGGGGGGGSGGGSVPNPLITVEKTHAMSTTTASTVDYKVAVYNEKYAAGPAYKATLTDTLYSPKGKILSNRSWDLDTLAPGDAITLTYSVQFPADAILGTYYNVARVSGFLSPTPGGSYPPMNPIEVRDDYEFAGGGAVLGASTSTVAISNSNLAISRAACVPLLTSNLRTGSKDRTGVMKLQSFLNTQGADLPVSGFFGPMTSAAVRAFQQKYAAEILEPLGLKNPTGAVYSSTIRQINRLVCGGADPTPSSSAGATTSAGPVDIVAPAAATPASVAPAKPKASAKAKEKAPAAASSGAGGFLNALSGFFSKKR